MTRSSAIRILDDSDVAEVLDLLARDPVPNVFVASRVESAGLDPWRLGAQLWGWPASGRLQSICYSGANLVPVAACEDAINAFVERAKRQGRRCSSIVGSADIVIPMWELLADSWGAAREVRPVQPLMEISRPSTIAPDTAVKRSTMADLEAILPACVAMFTEEVGVSPNADGGALYRARITELVTAGRSYARIDDGRVVFKAEVGAVTRAACQVQGVWVHPDLRGQGLSESGMAAVIAACRRDFSPTVSLYVNDFNTPAKRSYERVGFVQTGTFASVLF